MNEWRKVIEARKVSGTEEEKRKLKRWVGSKNNKVENHYLDEEPCL